MGTLKLTSPVNCVKFFNDSLVLAGCEDGSISIIGLPQMQVIGEIHDSASSIQSLLVLRNSFVGGKYDGTCVCYSLDSNNGQVGKERIVMTGADVDPIYAMARDQDYVFTASRDGCIRRYFVEDLAF